MDFDLLVRGGAVIFPGREVPADIGVRDGRVAAILAPGEPAAARETIDAGGLHVLPGCMDAHVHFGFAEPVTEYGTETASAAIGGLSTILAFVLSNGSYHETFEDQRTACAARAHVDFGFHFSTATQTHLDELTAYAGRCGVSSFKYFMNFKGEEGRYMGLSGTDDGFLYDLLHEAARIEDAVVVIHPENIEIVSRLRRDAMERGLDGLRAYHATKPPFVESENMVRAMLFAERTGATVYFPHVSCEAGLDEARWFRRRYDRVFVETCPHYLTHDENTDLGASIAKANPPLRPKSDIEALWAGLSDGTVDVVASDHVPRKRATKEKNVWQSTQGFPGSATILPVMLSEGHNKRGLPLVRIAELCAGRPAEIFGLAPRKGSIAVGADADFTIVDLKLEKTCRWQDLLSWSDYTPYEGWTFKGWPVRTMLRGRTVMLDGRLVGEPGYGDYLPRPLGGRRD